MTLLLNLAIATQLIRPTSAQTTIQLKIEPDFYFAKELGEEFDVNVTIYNVEASQHLVAIHFRLYYDPELLSVVSVTEGDFLPRFDQGSGTGFWWATEPDGVFGPHVVVGTMIMPNSTGQWPGPFPEGNGTVATIRFKVEYRPVEPEPIAVCVLRFLEVKLVDDQNNLITTYTTGISLYQSPVPMLYPIPSFTFTPSFPIAGQTVLFNASESYDPDGNVTEYTWDFGDGTTLTTNETVVTHIFTQPKVYNVTLFVTDNHGLQSNVTVPVEVGFYTPIEIEVTSGELYYAGEDAEFYISTSQLGKPVNVTFTELLLYFNGSQYANLSSLIYPITEGFYRVKYSIPSDAQSGIYSLYIKVEYSGLTGVFIDSFQVSNILKDINVTLIAIDGKIATLNSTLGIINGTIEKIEGDVATIKTDILGTIQVDISGIKDTADDINSTVDDIKSTTDDIDTKSSDIEGNLSSVLTFIYITLAFAIISAIAAIIAIILVRKS